jgi:hypothetical protein
MLKESRNGKGFELTSFLTNPFLKLKTKLHHNLHSLPAIKRIDSLEILVLSDGHLWGSFIPFCCKGITNILIVA